MRPAAAFPVRLCLLALLLVVTCVLPATASAAATDLSVSAGLYNVETNAPGVGYNFVVSNNGADQEGLATLSLTLADGLTFVSPADGSTDDRCSAAGQNVTCTLTAPMIDGEQTEIQVWARTLDPGYFETTAFVALGAEDTELNGMNNFQDEAVMVYPSTDLGHTLTVDPAGSIDVNDSVTFTATLTNHGPGETDATPRLTMPTGFVATAIPAGCNGLGSNEVWCAYNTFESLDVKVLEITATASGDAANSAGYTIFQVDPSLNWDPESDNNSAVVFVPVGPASNNDVTPTAGPDTLVGSSANSTVLGRGGDDRMFGLGGIDRLYGNGGADWLWGGTGSDRLVGGDGADHLYGEFGNDTVIGNGGDDVLYGSEGHDSIQGGDGRDLIVGGSGRDSISGGDRGDRIRVRDGEGNDYVVCGSGNDQVIADAGDRISASCERRVRRFS